MNHYTRNNLVTERKSWPELYYLYFDKKILV